MIATGLIGLFTASGCALQSAAVTATGSSTESRNVQVSATFSTGGGTAVTYDPVLVEPGARGAVSSSSTDGRTTVVLAIRGVAPDRRYGAHAHAAPCGATGEDAGPHFQFRVDPVSPSVDPVYANPDNEIWLDLTTDGTGAGSTEAVVEWQFPADRRARSVIIHAMPTESAPGRAGTAGSRAACIDVDF